MQLRTIRSAIAALPLGSAIFICYAIWYLVMMSHYSSASLYFWGSAVGMGAIVGAGFMLSGVASVRTGASRLRRIDLRLFLIPFCVSSFSSMAFSNDFVLIFAPKHSISMVAAGSCLVFLGLWAWLRSRYRSRN